MIGEGPTYVIHGSFESVEKRVSISKKKQKKTFACVCIITLVIVICLLMEKKAFNFKADNKEIYSSNSICFRSVTNGFSATESL